MKTFSKYLSGERMKATAVSTIRWFAVVSLFFSIYKIIMIKVSQHAMFDSVMVLLILSLTFPRSVELPSGSRWRPAVGLIIYGSFVFPFHVSVLITFMGLLLSNIKTKDSLKNILLSLGHLTCGIAVIRIAVISLAPTIGYQLPLAFSWAALALICHFIVNRLVSAVIVSYRKKNKLSEQWQLMISDMNWGYASIHILGMCMAFLYQAYGIWGFMMAVLLLYSIYSSIKYYEKANRFKILSLTDALTGAENRTSWEHFKEQFLSQGGQGTLALVDLDDFKGINDRWGHDVGDRLLCETVHCLRGIHPNENRVFRYGGDEFILYIPHHKKEQSVVEQMIQDHIRNKNKEWGERNYSIAISMGMKFVSSSTVNLDEFFIHLDQLMYTNKWMSKHQPTQNNTD